MTYGQYQMYPKGNLGGHYDMNIDPEIDRKNDYRKYPFPFSHLKTFKYWLFNKIDRKDFIDSTTNDIWGKNRACSFLRCIHTGSHWKILGSN